MTQLFFLILAAVLEVGGDALVRHGLHKRGILLIAAGMAALAIYGLMVNLTKLDFGKLMGVYIVLFFVVSQLVALLVFKERLQLPVMVGGALVVAGGIVMTIWKG
jgi:small multidrug resistance family-3 protein